MCPLCVTEILRPIRSRKIYFFTLMEGFSVEKRTQEIIALTVLHKPRCCAARSVQKRACNNFPVRTSRSFNKQLLPRNTHP